MILVLKISKRGERQGTYPLHALFVCVWREEGGFIGHG